MHRINNEIQLKTVIYDIATELIFKNADQLVSLSEFESVYFKKTKCSLDRTIKRLGFSIGARSFIDYIPGLKCTRFTKEAIISLEKQEIDKVAVIETLDYSNALKRVGVVNTFMRNTNYSRSDRL
jgi:hypothetical protein